MTTVYSERSQYVEQFRSELMPMLRPFWKNRTNLSEAETAAEYGAWVSDVRITNEPKGADLAVLPMSWNYYLDRKLERTACDFINSAKSAGLNVWTWCTGDFGVAPLVKDVHVFRPSGYQSKRLRYQFGMPVFFKDPLKENFKLNSTVIRLKTKRPTIGFCGQAHAPLYKCIYDVWRTGRRNLEYYLSLSYNEPQSLYPSTLRRQRALRLLERDSRIDCNFIVRHSYRAGARSLERKLETQREYFNNMFDSDYVLCIRGGGNFSTRLYETLAMGRIPVIVNTDCVFPLDEVIDWKRLGVWIEYDELHRIADRLTAFHENVSSELFEDMQRNARRLWEENLSMTGFFTTLLCESKWRAEVDMPY